jgi:hypothetical protein
VLPHVRQDHRCVDRNASSRNTAEQPSQKTQQHREALPQKQAAVERTTQRAKLQ